MKKIVIFTVILFCLCLPLAGCGNAKDVPEFIPPTTPPVPETPAVRMMPTPEVETTPDVALPAPELAELLPEPNSDVPQNAVEMGAVQAQAQTENQSQTFNKVLTAEQVNSMLNRKIADQSFFVTLDGFGGVYFNTIAPQTSDEDVCFILTDSNNNLVYYFPDTSPNNKLEGVRFDAIDTITFKDIDSDGRADVSILLTYAYPGGTTYTSCRIYSQKSGTTAYVMDKYDPDMSAYIIRQGYAQDYGTMIEGISAYFEYRNELAANEGNIQTVQNGSENGSTAVTAGQNLPVDEAFIRYFNEIIDNVMPGSSGCSLRGAFCAYNLLEYFYYSSVTFDYAKAETEKYMANLDQERLDVFKQSMMTVDNGRAILQGRDAKDMLLSIGKPTDVIPFGTGAVPAIDGMMNACGIR